MNDHVLCGRSASGTRFSRTAGIQDRHRRIRLADLIRRIHTFAYIHIHKNMFARVVRSAKLAPSAKIVSSATSLVPPSTLPPPPSRANRFGDGGALGAQDRVPYFACQVHFRMFNKLTYTQCKFKHRQHAHLLRQKRSKYQNSCSAFTGPTQPHFSKPLVPLVTWKK